MHVCARGVSSVGVFKLGDSVCLGKCIRKEADASCPRYVWCMCSHGKQSIN